jgi:hypothetical protein
VTATLIAQQAAELLELHRRIKSLDKHVADLFAKHEHAARSTSVAGFGPGLGAQLLADTAGGDLVATFGTPARLAAYAGLAPLPRDSGRVSATCTGHAVTAADYRTFSTWPRSARTSPDRPRPTTTASAAKANTTIRRCSPLLGGYVIWALLRDRRTFQMDPPQRAAPAPDEAEAAALAAA